ncbi:hypothetical protein, partial [Pseudoalteromonas piscicida]|uniref:hypothetical protein n=2 Tax=Pseudoalteromonas piscicida TaxID=43662 RepID=UPI001A8FE3BB
VLEDLYDLSILKMKPKSTTQTPQSNCFKSGLLTIVSLRHEQVKLEKLTLLESITLPIRLDRVL